jgi:ribosomal protein L16 Arg81 hydroxylase
LDLNAAVFQNDFFWEECFEKKFAFFSGVDLISSESVLEKRDFDDYLTRNLRASEIRVIKLGQKTSPFEYTVAAEPIDQQTQAEDMLVDIGKVLSAYSNGYTIVMQGIDSINARFHELIREMEEASSFSIFPNAYLTPAQAQGFPIHADDHDVLVWQIYGEKTWRIYEQLEASTMKRLKVPTDVKVLSEFRLQRGDVIYIPAGYPHEARTSMVQSGHVTLGLHSKKNCDIITAIIKKITEQNVELRQSSVLATRGKGSLESFERSIAILRSHLEDRKFLETCVRHFKLQQLTKRKSARAKGISDIDMVDEISPKTKITVYRSAGGTVDVTETSIGLYFRGSKIDFPLSMSCIVDFIVKNESFLYAELLDIATNLPEEAIRKIVKKLVVDGLISIGVSEND